MIEVGLCALITKDKKILLGLRSQNQSYPLSWCLPGGKRDNEDSDIYRAALRELVEEAGISVVHKVSDDSLVFTKNGYRFYTFVFNYCDDLPPPVISDELIDFRWMNYKDIMMLDNTCELTKDIVSAIANNNWL